MYLWNLVKGNRWRSLPLLDIEVWALPSCSTRNSDNPRTVPINEVATARRENASITNASPVPPKLHNIAHKTAKMGISIHLLQTSSQGYGTYPMALSRIQSFKENHIQKMSVEDESTCTLFCLLLQESVCIRMNIASERVFSTVRPHLYFVIFTFNQNNCNKRVQEGESTWREHLQNLESLKLALSTVQQHPRGETWQEAPYFPKWCSFECDPCHLPSGHITLQLAKPRGKINTWACNKTPSLPIEQTVLPVY